MMRVGKSIYSVRYFLAAGILLGAAAVIFGPKGDTLFCGLSHDVGRNLQNSVSPSSPLVRTDPPSGIDPRVPALLKEAEDAQAKGRLPEAVGLYEQVLALGPDLAPVYLKLGQLYFRIGLPSKAEEAYLQAIDKGLNDPDVFLYLGYIRETRGDLDQAMAYYAKAEFAASKNPILYFNMGNVYARQDQTEKALEYFKRAVILDPKYMDAFVNLAIVSTQAGEYADAQYYLEKAEKLGYDAPAEFKDGLAQALKK